VSELVAGHLRSREQVEVYSFGWPVTILAPLLAIFLQAFIPIKLHFFDVFDLPLLVTIYFAMSRRNPITGLLQGSIIGLVQDSLTRDMIGMYGIAKTLVGFAASQLGGKIDSDNPGSRFLLVLGFYLGHQAVYFAVARGLVREPLQWHWGHALLGAVANAFLGVFLFTVLDRFRQRA
jgi:rod shape-determining protein MreD